MRGHGEGSIYRDGGRWVAAISIEGPDGRARRRKRSARTQADAREALRALHEEARAGIAGSGRLTVAELVDDWLAHVLPARSPAQKTTENYEWAASHIRAGVGSIRVDHLRAENVDAMLRDLADRKVMGKAVVTVLLRTQADWQHGVHRRGELPK